MIEVEGLVKYFGNFKAVDDISLSVDQGTVLGFLGPNGAGKSTTMKLITGFLKPSKGKIKICNYNLETHPIEAKTRIGYLPEGAPTYQDMTPASYLNFIAQMYGYTGAQKEWQITSVVSKMFLHEVLHKPIETLSKGFKRRLGLAQAILNDPPILILDEPTDGLDPNQKYEVRSLIQTMATNKAIIISTHILEEVEAVCTKALILNKGRIIAHGNPFPDKNVWKFGPIEAGPGHLDAVFRQLTVPPLTQQIALNPPLSKNPS